MSADADTCSALHSLHLQEELRYLKALWDQAAAVLHTFQAWSSMLWGSINVEALMEECKQLTKDMKHLPKAVSVTGQTYRSTAL